MALIINGTTIPNSGEVIYNGTSLNEIMCDGVSVWRRSVLGWYTLSSNAHNMTDVPTQQFDYGTAIYTLSVAGYTNISRIKIEATYFDEFNNNYSKSVNQTINVNNNQTYELASQNTSQGRTLKLAIRCYDTTLELKGDWEFIYVWGTEFMAAYVINKIEVYGEPV